MSDVTILVSSAGRRGALLAALRHGGTVAGAAARVIVTDRSPLSAAGHLADSFHLVPPVNAPDFVDAMLDLVRRERVDAIVPTIDPELPVLAEHRQAFADCGATAVVSDPETIDICSDKGRSSRWLAEHGFPVPRQYGPEEAAALPAGAWPLFFKPRRGSSSVGAHPVRSAAELELATERYGQGVVEELIAGDEYTMDCWVDDAGTCTSVVPRLRLAVRAGEIAKGVTVRNNDLQQQVAAIVEALPGARGPVTVQAMISESGPHFIEINPRFGGGYPLSHQAGACYTAALVAETLGKPVDPGWFSWQDDLVMLRYDEAVFVPRSQVDAVGR
jgi:carbamoyl-phosphate synthase large subunit